MFFDRFLLPNNAYLATFNVLASVKLSYNENAGISYIREDKLLKI